ncbi:MAG: NAD(P)-dependent oxidoreductase [Synechococcales cyanobacterium CRU_2_2]|nr:NAD(P)-dependent oxidoreductase [Synechococcales cyanobacterium CRU_2_2]
MEYGLMGTGLMGAPMALRLHHAGLDMTVYNRTTEKVQHLAEAGIAIAGSPQALASVVDGVILMLTDAHAIRETLLTDAVKAALAGKTVLQMGTIGPSESQAIAQELQAANIDYLEAPVLGSIPQAQHGKLIVMVGSTLPQFEQWKSLLQTLGENVCHIGPVGTAMALKLSLNQLIAGLTNSFALSLAFAKQNQVPVDLFMAILRESALYAPTFDKKLARMQTHNFENPNFPTKHLLKDVQLFLKEAATLELQTGNLDGTERILEKAIALGFGELDYSAIAAAVEPRA